MRIVYIKDIYIKDTEEMRVELIPDDHPLAAGTLSKVLRITQTATAAARR